uniref:Uncharacterized protein n=1 Tax=Mycena chlorophos TaxID=658473 RepID=A0ABQ0L1C1_MYCCL|nr:predicted protein [Mycena chlorophos]
MPSSSPDDTPTALPNEAFCPPDVQTNLACLELQVCFASRRHQLYDAPTSALGNHANDKTHLTSSSSALDADHLAHPRFSQRRAGLSPVWKFECAFCWHPQMLMSSRRRHQSLQSDDVSGRTTQGVIRTRCGSNSENLDSGERCVCWRSRRCERDGISKGRNENQLGNQHRIVWICPTTQVLGPEMKNARLEIREIESARARGCDGEGLGEWLADRATVGGLVERGGWCKWRE